jgi:phosphatidylglycerol:prolipoprotein diacylglycerol transferase
MRSAPLPPRILRGLLPRSADRADARPLQVMTFACEPLAGLEPRSLGLTYWFEAAAEGEPYPVTIRFTGRRVGVNGEPSPKDRFSINEHVKHVVPGSGRVAVTARVGGVAPGEWDVTATPVSDPQFPDTTNRSASRQRPSMPRASSSGAAGYGPVIQVRAPGARLGAWPALVGLGVVVGLTTQALLANHFHLHPVRVLLESLAASLVGLLGAKFYYLAGHYLMRHFLAEHRSDQRPAMATVGMCIQGFVAGAIVTLAVEALVTGVPIGRLLDVTAPGLLLGMTIGRLGCFFGGCCAGRPTASRWGVWSSDRRLGVRRIPTQIFESTLALLIAVPALVAVWETRPHPAGVVFVGSLAAYTLGRQLLFPLRDNPRKTAHGLSLTMMLTGLVVVIDVAVGVFA